MADKEYINRLRLAIFHMYKCDAKHFATVAVHETFQGETIWKGEVEVFDVSGHPRARRAYSWSFKDANDEERITAVLGLPPVKSAVDAVKVSIIARANKRV